MPRNRLDGQISIGAGFVQRATVMQHPGFFERSGPYTVHQLAQQLNVSVDGSSDTVIEDVKTLQDAGPNHVAFFNNKKYI